MKARGLFFVVFVLLLSGICQVSMAMPDGQRLRDLARPLGMLFGYASRSNFQSMTDSQLYCDVVRREFSILTPENDMKMEALQPYENYFDFDAADRHVQFAAENGIFVHGHTLVWHSQTPAWIRNIEERSRLIDAMHNHIDRVLAHYRGRILVWDVVNEAFEDNGTYRNSFWYRVIGQDYIDLAFQRARQADPCARLIYNDYNLAEKGSKSDAVYAMLKSMLERGIPVDGVGFQMHITDEGLDYGSFKENMARFAALGLDIYITEMDVRIPRNPSMADISNQSGIYRQVMECCLAEPACRAIQVWGVPDKYSWVPDVFPGKGAPLLFDDDYNAKPSYYAVQKVLHNTVPRFFPVIPGFSGDLNNDGKVTIVDAFIIAKFFVGYDLPCFIPTRADVNCDGIISITDALQVAQFAVGFIDHFDC